MDPFSKTSFDALLESLVEIETERQPSVAMNDGRQDPFPGFPGLDASAPHQVMQMAQQEVAAHQALYAQIMQQQQRLETMTQGLEFSRFQQPAILTASTSAPTSPMSGMHQQRSLSPPLPPSQAGGSAPIARPGTLHRLSLDGRPGMQLSNGMTGGPMFGGGMSSVGGSYASEPAYLSDSQVPSYRLGNVSEPMPSDGESLPAPFPRASLQHLGVMPSHSDDLHVAGIDVHTGTGSERRREKNRIAQRRFRERQKTTVAMLQTELDQKEAEMQRMSSQLRALEQTNQALLSKLQHYEKAYGALPGSR